MTLERVSPTEPEIIGSMGVQAITGLSRKVIRRWTEQGIIPFFVQLENGHYRYHRPTVVAWWQERDRTRDTASATVGETSPV